MRPTSLLTDGPRELLAIFIEFISKGIIVGDLQCMTPAMDLVSSPWCPRVTAAKHHRLAA